MLLLKKHNHVKEFERLGFKRVLKKKKKGEIMLIHYLSEYSIKEGFCFVFVFFYFFLVKEMKSVSLH